MMRRTARKSSRKLFDEKERLLKEQPGLSQSYSQFLQDWEKYSKFQQVSKKAEESHNYLVFGASFQE